MNFDPCFSFQITPQCTEEMYIGCQFDTLFENEMTAYTDIIPALGKADHYPKYETRAFSVSAKSHLLIVHHSCRYFYSHRKPFEAVMVLSDYSTEGWRMAPMVVNLPLDYCLLAGERGQNLAVSLSGGNFCSVLFQFASWGAFTASAMP